MKLLLLIAIIMPKAYSKEEKNAFNTFFKPRVYKGSEEKKRCLNTYDSMRSAFSRKYNGYVGSSQAQRDRQAMNEKDYECRKLK